MWENFFLFFLVFINILMEIIQGGVDCQGYETDQSFSHHF